MVLLYTNFWHGRAKERHGRMTSLRRINASHCNVQGGTVLSGKERDRTMKKVRLGALALVAVLLSIALLVPVSAAAASSHASASTTTHSVTNRLTGLPVSGTTSAGGTFKGVLNITSFAAQNTSLVAQGTLNGTVRNAAGKVIGTVHQAVTLPVSIDPSCTILTLVIGPIHLNLLGLVIDVSQITVTITAQPGTLLGGLLCQLAGATTLQQIVTLLNQILALLGG